MSTSGYLTIADFKARTIMPSADVDRLDQSWLETTLDDWSEEIDDRLRKRYDVPFAKNGKTPRIILRWLTKLVTRDCYAKRGWNPTSQQDRESIEAAAENAETSLKEAADAKDGLYDLPLKDDLSTSSAITQGSPLGYSEQSPYRWTDLQEQDGRNEDG